MSLPKPNGRGAPTVVGLADAPVVDTLSTAIERLEKAVDIIDVFLHDPASVSRLSGKFIDAVGTTLPDSAARVAYKLQDAVAGLASDPASFPNQIYELKHSHVLGGVGALLTGLTTFIEAQERGVGQSEAEAEGYVSTIVDLKVNALAVDLKATARSRATALADTALNLASAVMEVIAPQWPGTVALQEIAGRTASQTLVGSASYVIEAIEPTISGDGNRMIDQYDRALKGDHGAVMRDIASLCEGVAVSIVGNRQDREAYSDAAASGELGSGAQLGDFLGEWFAGTALGEALWEAAGPEYRLFSPATVTLIQEMKSRLHEDERGVNLPDDYDGGVGLPGDDGGVSVAGDDDGGVSVAGDDDGGVSVAGDDDGGASLPGDDGGVSVAGDNDGNTASDDAGASEHAADAPVGGGATNGSG